MIFHSDNKFKFFILLLSSFLIFTSCKNKTDKSHKISNYDFLCKDLDVKTANSNEYICHYLSLYGEGCFFEKNNSAIPTIDLTARIIDFPNNDFDTLFIFTFYGKGACHYLTCKYMSAHQFSPYHQALNDPKISYHSVVMPLSDSSYNKIFKELRNLNITAVQGEYFFSKNKVVLEIMKDNEYKYYIEPRNNMNIINLIKSKFF